jgi:hypothetical protein
MGGIPGGRPGSPIGGGIGRGGSETLVKRERTTGFGGFE